MIENTAAEMPVTPPISENAGVTKADTRSLYRIVPLAGGVIALVLAAVGEILVESANRTQLPLVLFLAAIALFAVSAWPLPPAPYETPAPDAKAPTEETSTPDLNKRRVSRRSALIVTFATAAALAITGFALLQLRQDLRSNLGIYGWVAAILILMAGSIAAGRRLGWAPRWGRGVWPQTARGRWALFFVSLAFFAVAAVARFADLDKLPLGINADEGDRAAVAIQVIRGDNTNSIFYNGWYWISMLYFWLLAQLMKVIGIGYVQARVFGGLFSLASVGIITWIGIRHFGMRVGLIAGAILSVLAVSLQFARETSEAGPTATLWALSVALFLEAARTGKRWAWAGAGVAGGLSLYFYPSGRLWAVVAALFCLYLLVHGLGGRRKEILLGSILAAVAASIVMSPFLLHSMDAPEMITQRASETSIFTPNNPTRLHYYNPEWSMPHLLAAQLERVVGIFHEYHDEGGFWPTDKPVMSGLLAMLTLLGMGWVCTRWRDPRFVLLAVWIVVGLSGAVVTVETPNLQRMATAIPALALLPALVIDSMARRVNFLAAAGQKARTAAAYFTGAAALATVAFLMWTQYNLYFNFYATVDRWPAPTSEGKAVNNQGRDTLVVTLGRQYHMINSGWIRLLAPYTPRGGVKFPGLDLPLAIPADRNLAFMVYPAQQAYLPYIQSLYPGGTLLPFIHPTDGLQNIIYRVSKRQWAETQGAMAEVSGGTPVHVPALGAVPPGVKSFPAAIRWHALLRVPQYWNYSFKVGSGITRLSVDGKELQTAQDGQASVSLARGDHYLVLEATVTAADKPVSLQWLREPQEGDNSSSLSPDWKEITASNLISASSGQRGLYGVVRITNPEHPRAEQRRIDNTLAMCCLNDGVKSEGHPFTVDWSGTLNAPTTGTYSMTLYAQGLVRMTLDGATAFQNSSITDKPLENNIDLKAGPHQIEVHYEVKDTTGALEWIWTPPGGEKSIVPADVLVPLATGLDNPVPQAELGKDELQPTSMPLETVP